MSRNSRSLLGVLGLGNSLMARTFWQQQFNEFFEMEGNLVAFSNINGVMATLNIEYGPCDWRLFIDSSKTSLKGVLMRYRNSKPYIPIGYAAQMKETYGNIK